MSKGGKVSPLLVWPMRGLGALDRVHAGSSDGRLDFHVRSVSVFNIVRVGSRRCLRAVSERKREASVVSVVVVVLQESNGVSVFFVTSCNLIEDLQKCRAIQAARIVVVIINIRFIAVVSRAADGDLSGRRRVTIRILSPCRKPCEGESRCRFRGIVISRLQDGGDSEL